MQTLKDGTPETLHPYIDCAPLDLTFQGGYCPKRRYATAADLSALLAKVRSEPRILQEVSWRDFPPADPLDPVAPQWVMYTHSTQWVPCGLPNAPLISLHRDQQGDIRIAGFAASCLNGL